MFASVLCWKQLRFFVLYCDLQEHIDYDLVQSTNPEFNKAVIRVNIYREHRQTIQVFICLL